MVSNTKPQGNLAYSADDTSRSRILTDLQPVFYLPDGRTDREAVVTQNVKEILKKLKRMKHLTKDEKMNLAIFSSI